MIEIVEYRPEHMARVKPEAVDGDLSGPAVTFMDGESPIAVFGWNFVTRGTVQVWAILGEGIHRRKKSFHKAVKELIAASFGKCVVNRMQMSVKVGFERGRAWALSLGFTQESVMRRYGSDGSDYWLFVRFKD